MHIRADRALVDEPEVWLDVGSSEAGHGGLVFRRVGRDLEHLGDADGGKSGFVEGDGCPKIWHRDVEVIDAGAGPIEIAGLRSSGHVPTVTAVADNRWPLSIAGRAV